MKTIEKLCVCGNKFFPSLKEVKRGNGKYCSRSCSSRNRPKKKPNSSCKHCGKDFYRSEYRKSLSKSGDHFCSKKCKDADSLIISERSYRSILKIRPAKCERCGYDKYPEILEVHHKDRDRQNNDPMNLEIVCPNCHTIEHKLRGM